MEILKIIGVYGVGFVTLLILDYIWLGVSIISLQISTLGLIGFLIITGLLLFVSGIPLKEERYKTKKNWREYSKKTPKFIPNYFL